MVRYTPLTGLKMKKKINKKKLEKQRNEGWLKTSAVFIMFLFFTGYGEMVLLE